MIFFFSVYYSKRFATVLLVYVQYNKQVMMANAS